MYSQLRKLYRKLVPIYFRQKIKDKQEINKHRLLIKEKGHIYSRFYNSKSIFIHIPKAGGISILKSLYGQDVNGFGHPTYRRFLNMFGRHDFNSFYKFTFVRNPWDRTLSAYQFLKRGGMHHLDKKFCDDVLAQYETFYDFVLNGLTLENANNWVHFIPQYLYVYDENLNLKVDFIGRFEGFSHDFETVRNTIGVGSALVHLNKTQDKKHINYREYYTPEMIEVINQIYKEDIKLFNYQF
jgi:hypothetical protein